VVARLGSLLSKAFLDPSVLVGILPHGSLHKFNVNYLSAWFAVLRIAAAVTLSLNSGAAAFTGAAGKFEYLIFEAKELRAMFRVDGGALRLRRGHMLTPLKNQSTRSDAGLL